MAYSSNICQGTTCTSEEVGVFMQDITRTCGNTGTCSLNDILLVFSNTANFILSIIGGLVLLMYVVGGVFFISAGGSQDRISRGKKFLKMSTVGLLIVMFAYLGIMTLKNTLTIHSTVTGDIDTTDWVACDGTAATDGEPCAQLSTCVSGVCITACEAGGNVCVGEEAASSPLYSGCSNNSCPGGGACCSVVSP